MPNSQRVQENVTRPRVLTSRTYSWRRKLELWHSWVSALWLLRLTEPHAQLSSPDWALNAQTQREVAQQVYHQSPLHSVKKVSVVASYRIAESIYLHYNACKAPLNPIGRPRRIFQKYLETPFTVFSFFFGVKKKKKKTLLRGSNLRGDTWPRLVTKLGEKIVARTN